MGSIEKYLHEHFASTEEAPEPALSSGRPAVLPDHEPETLSEPFAKVNSVAAGSPAESAGLKAGDQIRTFGYVNRSNHDGLKKVGECVQGNEGNNILIQVCRSSGATQQEELRLTLCPRRNWGGRGMLGCHILPI